MYNHIKGEPDAINFELYPHDMLLYYDYSLVPQARCRSYFEQLAEADFFVFSAALSYKSTELFANARSCLGVTNTSLTEDNISVLGNMCCILNGSYIENSDPSILEKLGNCQDLTSNQVAAVEAVLQSGKTKHGAPSTWNEQTLKDLGMLPLHLTSTFYDNFDKKTKKRFLKYFLKVLRSNRVSRQKRKSLKAEIKKSRRSKRSIQNECTVGMITQVTISDETFPFDYDDITQFDRCLSASTVRDNLDAITEKVDQEDNLKIVLSKLGEAYADTSIIPEDQVQLLGPASRVATIDDINMWSITEIDTLSDLMDSSNGEWNSSLAKAIISKYLSNNGNTLGSPEINAITGINLCSLDADVLKTISQQSLKEASTLNVSVCTTEKKKELFNIARQAFSTRTRSAISADTYRLMQPFLGGADSDYIQNLVNSNINMDLSTFTSLDEDVLLNLNVDQVQSLLGTNLADLKSYENEAVIQNWTSRQSQEDLDKLGIGLMGGRVDPTSSTSPTTTGSPTTSNSITTATGSPTTSSSVTTTTGSPTTSNSMTTTTGSPTTSNSMTTTGSPTTINSLTPTIASSLTTTNTTGNGARIRPDACLSFLALLTLLITSLV
ncbi:mesothelin-like protein [Plectropomus leopardus]|uniref:mesothelin-like protein n=1 Tax=Plectropomus leopardus TaxID=160734 RepID=UPI001C4BB968|nr:mesothelin-like protein [Plectropomus leopardus]